MSHSYAGVPKRLVFLSGVALLLVGILVARWIADWGLVTIHVKDAPLGKVISSIARQGHVRVESSLSPDQLVSLDVDKVSPVVAVDILSLRIDSSWRVVYLAAASKEELKEAVASLTGTGNIEGWTTHFYPGPPFSGENGLAIDPRRLELKIEGPDAGLSKLLDEVAQKSGVMTASPHSWETTAKSLPKPNQVGRVLPALIGSAHGKMAEFFFITKRQRQWDGGEHADIVDASADQPSVNPDWREQQQLAQIDLLPPEEQPAAKEEHKKRKAFFAQLRGLSPKERREKWQQMMADPDNFQQMMDKMLVRQANQSANQRIQRAVNYLNRKAAAH